LWCAGDCRRLIESGIVGIVIGELGGDIIEANAHFLALTGYDRSDFPLRWEKVLVPQTPGEQERIAELLERGEVSPWEAEILAEGSEPIPALVAATRLGDAGRECVAFVLDLTRIREAEEAQERDQARYKALFEQSPSLSVTIDRRGSIVSVNTHGARTLGYETSELVGGSIFALVDERDRPSLNEQIEIAAASPGEVVSGNLRQLRKDGSTLWASVSLRLLPQARGDEEFLLVCKDVTPLKTTEQRLLDYHERLRMLASDLVLAEERTKRRIATLLHDDVGHSLALAQIRLGRIEQEGAGDTPSALGPVRDLIAEAIKATRELTFELSSPVLYELGLESALESLLDRLSTATGAQFALSNDGAPRTLHENVQVLLFRSVRELLLNAAKHAEAHRTTVTVQTAGDVVRIRVTDDGIGFDIDEGMAPGGGGTGHGLVSVEAQVRSMGGRFEVDTEPGKGTSCLIVVPLDSGVA